MPRESRPRIGMGFWIHLRPMNTATHGVAVGATVGVKVGVAVGPVVGKGVGDGGAVAVGAGVGEIAGVGATVVVGEAVALGEGVAVGDIVTVGCATLGVALGRTVGVRVGAGAEPPAVPRLGKFGLGCARGVSNGAGFNDGILVGIRFNPGNNEANNTPARKMRAANASCNPSRDSFAMRPAISPRSGCTKRRATGLAKLSKLCSGAER